MPQGSILGPFLFNLLLSGIGLQLAKSRVILYADDTAIFAPEKNSTVVTDKLNHGLATLDSFFIEK